MPLIFWLTLARGVFAIVIGTIMLVYPAKTPGMIVNFMGMFWLASGFVSVRWGMMDYRHRRMALVAGTIAILAGVTVLTRNLTLYVVQEYLIVVALGVVVLLTGLLHLFGGFSTSQQHSEHQRIPGLLLGVFEVLLGSLLIISPLERGPFVYYSASIWALVCGVLLIGDALALRRLRLRQQQSVHWRVDLK